MLTPRQIIAEAWAITIRERMIKRWGFTHALLVTLKNLELILYQAYFLYWYARGESVGWLSVEVIFFENLPLWLFIGITLFLLVLFVIELFLPIVADGAVIGLTAKAHYKEEVKGGLVLGLYNFFPILEIHGMFVLTSATLVFTICSLLLRYGGTNPQLKTGAMLTIVILWLVACLFRLFANFAEEAVVIKKTGVFHAIGTSFKLVISYITQLMFLAIVMFVISLRILINTIVILLIPGLAIGLGLILAFFLPALLSYSIASVVALILVVIASYFLAYLYVFKQAVWTITFIELSRQKDLDVIGG